MSGAGEQKYTVQSTNGSAAQKGHEGQGGEAVLRGVVGRLRCHISTLDCVLQAIGSHPR